MTDYWIITQKRSEWSELHKRENSLKYHEEW